MQNKVRHARLEKHLSQGLLAQQTGVARQTINSIENGRSVPSLELAFKLSRVLDRRIEDLFALESQPSPALPSPGIRVDPPILGA